MKKKSLLIYSLVLILGLSCLGGYHSYAGTALISKGRMEFDNNTPETEDDAIFDVDDLKALNTKISEAEVEINNIETSINNSKKEIVNILNQNPNINIGEEVSFPDIITYIQGSTNVPADTYFYEKGTEGSAAIVRYKKVGGKYYKCDTNGKVAQGAQEVNVSGKQLEDYAATKAGNLSAGAAGYANGGFYLGDGSDQNQNRVGTAVAADVLAGKTFSNSTGSGLTGTMVNRGTLNWNPTSNTTQTVQPGYYSGGTLNSAGAYNKGKADGAAASKVGNVAPGQVLSGKTFTNSTTVGATGTMPNKGAWTNAPTTKGKVTIPPGYHNGSGYVDTSGVYAKGYTDGKAEAVGSANITYTYHKHIGSSGKTPSGCYTVPVYHVHSDSCYNICPGTWVYQGRSENNHGVTQDFYICSIDASHGPGHVGAPYNGGNGAGSPCSHKTLVCSLGNTIEAHSLGCGKDTSTIESATITY